MSVPFRRKPGGKEKGVKNPLMFIKRSKNNRPVTVCDRCKNFKLLHHICKKCK